jgi:hypothetical protein
MSPSIIVFCLPMGLRRRLRVEPHCDTQLVQADQADSAQPGWSSPPALHSTWQASDWAGGRPAAPSSRQSSRVGRPVPPPALLQPRLRLRRPSPQVSPRGRMQGDQSPGSQRADLQLAASSGQGRTCTSSGQRSPPFCGASSTLRSRRCVSISKIPPPPPSGDPPLANVVVDAFWQVSGQRDHSAHSETVQGRGQGTAQWRRFSRVRSRLQRQAGSRPPPLSTQFTLRVWSPCPHVWPRQQKSTVAKT